MSKTITLTDHQWVLIMQALDEAVKKNGLNGAAQLLPIAFEIEKQVKTSSEEDKKENPEK
jgi:uncharacterized protein (DUF1778 family)